MEKKSKRKKGQRDGQEANILETFYMFVCRKSQTHSQENDKMIRA